MKLVAAGFSGVRGLKEGLVEEGSRGTVGKPGGEDDVLEEKTGLNQKYPCHV